MKLLNLVEEVLSLYEPLRERLEPHHQERIGAICAEVADILEYGGNFLITEIRWDTDDLSHEEAEVPSAILALAVPGFEDENEQSDFLSDLISDAFGYCHAGFEVERLDRREGQGFYIERLAVVIAP